MPTSPREEEDLELPPLDGEGEEAEQGAAEDDELGTADDPNALDDATGDDDPVELDVRSDVYALAGTIYNVTTGRAFFDDIENNRDRIIAHMRRDPFEEAERLKPYPTAIAKLLRAAVAKDPRDRPSPMEFGRAFGGAL